MQEDVLCVKGNISLLGPRCTTQVVAVDYSVFKAFNGSGPRWDYSLITYICNPTEDLSSFKITSRCFACVT